MSYFIELPDLDEKGLTKVWDGLAVVGDRTIKQDAFHIAAPLEFRFVKSGSTAMSGSYSTTANLLHQFRSDRLDRADPGALNTPSSCCSSSLTLSATGLRWADCRTMERCGRVLRSESARRHVLRSVQPELPLRKLRKLSGRRGGERLTAFNAFRKASDPGKSGSS